jgi:hypothetical protein
MHTAVPENVDSGRAIYRHEYRPYLTVKKYAMGMSKTTDGAALNLAGQLRLRK